MCFWLGKCLKVKNQLLTFRQWERFFGGCVLLVGEMLFFFFFFSKILLTGEVFKTLNMLQWGNHVCISMPYVHKHGARPFLTFIPFLEFPQSEAIFEKVFNISQPEAYSILFFNFSPARSTFHYYFIFIKCPQPEAHPETQFLTFPQSEAHFRNMNVFNISPARSTSNDAIFNISPARSRFSKKNILRFPQPQGFWVQIRTSSRNWLKIQDTQDRKNAKQNVQK